MKVKSQIAIGIILLILGFLLTNSIKKSFMNIEMNNSSEELKELQNEIVALQTQIDNLKTKNSDLKAEVDKKNSEDAKDNSYFEETLNKIEMYENIIGLRGVQGEGISMVIKPIKNPLGQIQRGINSNDLVYIVNELWHANAEAISIEDNRITFRTSICPSGDFIIINDNTRISTSSEIKIKAIGDVDKLYTSMKMPGLFQNITTKVTLDGPYKEDNVIIKGYDGSLDYNLLKPVETE